MLTFAPMVQKHWGENGWNLSSHQEDGTTLDQWPFYFTLSHPCRKERAVSFKDVLDGAETLVVL